MADTIHTDAAGFDFSGRRITKRQLDMIRSLPGTAKAEIEAVDFRIPASEYLDEERFDREIEQIYFGCPVIVAVSADLPAPGTYCRKDFLGVPVLLTRDASGQVSAFLNVCTHRGTVLCPSKETGKGKLMICPYHAWSFSLDGKLVGVPREQIFKDLDKSEYNLRRLECVESGGLIWVGLKRDRDIDFSNITGELEADLGAFELGKMHKYRTATYDVKGNWKLVMDSMLDTYHVTRLHKNTLAKFFVDSPSVTQSLGPHLVSAGSRANFDYDALDDNLDTVRSMAVLTYNLFPNGIIVLSPDYISVAILRPVAVDRTEIEYIMMSDGQPADESMEKKLDRSFKLMDAAFGNEDFWAAELGQEGLRSGAIKEVVLGGMESQMMAFHDEVNKALS